jgi:septum formation inhibitor-activating ATPase MinD
MKTIAINSIKGGTRKSTLTILLIYALARTDCRCLALSSIIGLLLRSWRIRYSSFYLIKRQ